MEGPLGIMGGKGGGEEGYRWALELEGGKTRTH